MWAMLTAEMLSRTKYTNAQCTQKEWPPQRSSFLTFRINPLCRPLVFAKELSELLVRNYVRVSYRALERERLSDLSDLCGRLFFLCSGSIS